MPSAPALYDEGTTRVDDRGGAHHPTPYLIRDYEPTVPNALLDLVAEVEALALLEADWDGEFSPRVEADAISRARWFLEHLQVPWLPLVGANTLGGVRIEWDAGAAYLIIDFEPGGQAQVLFGAPGREVQVWRNDEIPGGLAFYYADVNRARREP